MSLNKNTKYFRNWQEVEGIEPDALWYLSETGDYVLVDDDQHIVCPNAMSDQFYQIELV